MGFCGEAMGQRAWHEDLPEGCPPNQATVPHVAPYFRAVRAFPLGDLDFVSRRELDPGRRFPVSECIARAVSLQEDRTRCVGLLKLPRYRGGFVVALELPAAAGLVMATSSPGHVSWWRQAGFDPVPYARLVEVE